MDTIYYVFVLGFIFAFSFFMTYISYDTFETFLAWLLIITAFFVWTAILELWILILLIIINVLVVGINKYKKVGV